MHLFIKTIFCLFILLSTPHVFAQSSLLKIGDDAPEISLPNVNGKILNLYDFKGDLVLVDFWAGWCGPCRKMNRKLVKGYDKYKEDLVIFSISLDLHKKVWLKAIEKDALIWETHVSDLKGFDTPSVKLYGVEAIPNNFLIDAEGKILAIDVSVSDLRYFIKQHKASQ